ncbi:DUF1150 family protein [Rhodospirillum centenum]|uniref:DUF1150 family protein n=1 Tax=Rhodospirillum centenum (strain ATCC 51521 / SW) TaxID=414684 RepID=B6IW94_RHOCS|nr:DUF1150 family protein [Rhodospirillum centenum]ACJ00568.1 conserved hypothetical protein [Rhodospirillum centenum SW]
MNPTSQSLRTLSAQDFATFGLNDLAYLKPVTAEGRTGIAIHAADGTELTVVQDRALAVVTVRQNDMEAVSLH